MYTQFCKDLTKEFGSRVFEPINKRDYNVVPEDLNKLFRIYNKHMFNNKIAPMQVHIRARSHGDVLAAFQFGLVKGHPVSMWLFNAIQKSFFTFMNDVAHELIHAYDWTCGPLNKMYQLFYHLGFEENAWSKERNHPTQVAFDPRFYDYRLAIAAKAKVYDCHGRWFQTQADKFNHEGLDIKDVVNPFEMKSRFIPLNEDPDETPIELRHLNDDNPIRMMFDSLKNVQHKAICYRDPENWFIEIS